MLKILIAEDGMDDIIVLKHMMKNYNLTFSETAATFLAELEQSEFDLLIMDIALPGSKNGLELIKEVRENIKYKTIPIICATSNSYSQQEMNARNAGANYYLTKPYKKVDLLGIVESLNMERNIS